MIDSLFQRRRCNQVAGFNNLRAVTARHHSFIIQQHLRQHVRALLAGLAAVAPILRQQLLKVGRLRQGREKTLFAASLPGAFRTLGRHNYNATWANWGRGAQTYIRRCAAGLIEIHILRRIDSCDHYIVRMLDRDAGSGCNKTPSTASFKSGSGVEGRGSRVVRVQSGGRLKRDE
jgi:hypothetical protein